MKKSSLTYLVIRLHLAKGEGLWPNKVTKVTPKLVEQASSSRLELGNVVQVDC